MPGVFWDGSHTCHTTACMRHPAAVIDPQQPFGIGELILVKNRDVMVFARFAHGKRPIMAILRLPMLALSLVAEATLLEKAVKLRWN